MATVYGPRQALDGLGQVKGRVKPLTTLYTARQLRGGLLEATNNIIV